MASAGSRAGPPFAAAPERKDGSLPARIAGDQESGRTRGPWTCRGDDVVAMVEVGLAARSNSVDPLEEFARARGGEPRVRIARRRAAISCVAGPCTGGLLRCHAGLHAV